MTVMTLIARSSLRATFRTSGRDATLEIDEQIGVDQCGGEQLGFRWSDHGYGRRCG